MGIYADYLDRQFSFEDLVAERKKQLGRIASARKRGVLVIAADLRSRLASLTGEDLLAINDQLSSLEGTRPMLSLRPLGGQVKQPKTSCGSSARDSNRWGSSCPGRRRAQAQSWPWLATRFSWGRNRLSAR